MLILSQHKIVILNFNTTTTIIADKNEIIARLINGNKATLGKYATEERAKEVLQDIITSYREIESYKITGDKMYSDIIMKNTFVYEMPQG